jgi:hypothetical protein
LITGEPPFAGPTMAVIDAHRHQQPRSISSRRTECPAQLARAVMRMLEKRPEKRWPSITDGVAGYSAIPPVTIREGLRLEMRRLGVRAASIEIEGVAPLKPGEETRLQAIARSATGSVLGRRKAEWVSSRLEAVRMGDAGEARALAAGEVEIAAIVGDVAGRVKLTVLPPPPPVVKIPTTIFTPAPTLETEAPAAPTGERDRTRTRRARVAAEAGQPRHLPSEADGTRRLWPWLTLAGTAIAAGVVFVVVSTADPDVTAPLQLPPHAAAPISVDTQPDTDAGSEETPPVPVTQTATTAVQPLQQPAAAAVDTPRRRVVAPPAPPPAPAPAPPPAPPPSPPPVLEGTIDDLMSALETAFETGSAERVRRVYPGLSGEESWWRVVRSFGDAPIDVMLYRQNVVNQGTTATAVYSGRVSDAARQSPPFVLRIQLERASQSSWRITRIVN